MENLSKGQKGAEIDGFGLSFGKSDDLKRIARFQYDTRGLVRDCESFYRWWTVFHPFLIPLRSFCCNAVLKLKVPEAKTLPKKEWKGFFHPRHVASARLLRCQDAYYRGAIFWSIISANPCQFAAPYAEMRRKTGQLGGRILHNSVHEDKHFQTISNLCLITILNLDVK